MLHCDLRVRWKVASDLRFRAAISQPKTPSFCGISGDLAPSTRKSLAIAMVRFWCAKGRIEECRRKTRPKSLLFPSYNRCVPPWSGPSKPNQGKVSSWTFRRGIPEQKFNVNRACFPKEKHQNSQNGQNS